MRHVARSWGIWWPIKLRGFFNSVIEIFVGFFILYSSYMYECVCEPCVDASNVAKHSVWRQNSDPLPIMILLIDKTSLFQNVLFYFLRIFLSLLYPSLLYHMLPSGLPCTIAYISTLPLFVSFTETCIPPKVLYSLPLTHCFLVADSSAEFYRCIWNGEVLTIKKKTMTYFKSQRLRMGNKIRYPR